MVSLPRRPARRTAVAVAAGLVVVLLVAGLAAYRVRSGGPGYRVQQHTITVRTGPDGRSRVPLDTSLYVPSGATGAHPAPAVLLAHGFGGTKNSVAGDAQALARRGYVVLTWTAQGFGDSGGTIHLDSPDWEVTDARRLVSWLAGRPEVRRDGRGDPRVGVVGGSYGGALALLLAAADHRVDAIVPQITWNDLGRSLFPDADGGPVTDGVLKRSWLGRLFAAGLSGGAGQRDAPPDGTAGETAGGTPGRGGVPVPDVGCGRFAARICTMYRRLVGTGRADARAEALLRRSSPATVLDRVRAPTLLIQGLADTLFGVGEADANARGIAATGTPVRVAWYSGGHDGGDGSPADQDRVRYLTAQWLDHYLKGSGPAPGTSFTFSRTVGYDRYEGAVRTAASGTDRYPGLDGDRPARTVRLSGGPQRIASPPDGIPAAVSTVPGAGIAGLAGATEVPGEAAAFRSRAMPQALDLTGAPSLTVRARSSSGSAVLFVKLYDVAPGGGRTLVAGQAAAVRLSAPPGAPAGAQLSARVTLPGMVHRFAAGHRVEVVVDTADRAYAGPRDPATYTVGLRGGVRMPAVAAHPLTDPAGVWYWLLLAVVVLLALVVASVLAAAAVRRRRRQRAVVAEFTDIPLHVRDLRKTYRGGVVAVRNVTFTVGRGQVVGLLGPNGAGKTTSLRMVLGLMRASAGEALVFGHRVSAGAPVLSRIGSLVERPGFLPHLSGLDNLRLYWRSTGRPREDARLDEVLAIAGLGDAVRRRVRTYSHGMRQRLAIAQAMLGLPELLVLDEPTDGLDPPQIAGMRQVLRRYAEAGRSVLVSSHLLAEVEQTCTHVVVLRDGERVAEGPVAEIVGESSSVLIGVSDMDKAESALRRLSRVRSVARQDGDLVVELAEQSRAQMIAALVSAGVAVDRVVPRRRLEDAFLALLEKR